MMQQKREPHGGQAADGRRRDSEMPSRIAELAAAWEEFRLSEGERPVDERFLDALAQVLIMANSLAEWCASLGLREVSAALGAVETSLSNLPDTSGEWRGLLISEVSSKISHAESLGRREGRPPAAERGRPRPALGADPRASELSLVVDNPDMAALLGLGSGAARHVYIVSKDPEFAEECATQVGHYGYEARAFESLAEFNAAVRGNSPVAVVADLDLAQSEPAAMSAFKTTWQGVSAPMIVVGTAGDFEARLQAVRAGSTAYFSKPVNVPMLLDKLDAAITSAYVIEPFRVLVIDDSETMIGFLRKTLEAAGMSVHVESQPDRVLSAIGDFNPDLILMDMYMPTCDGQELSRIIRQYESFTSIPIVFLSSETNVKKQLAAMQIGADDFLTKPIDPEHLVMSVATRVQRHRILSSYMVQDSLTGLLNHTKLKQRLDQTLQKALRSKIPMAFAMIDIDHFKRVNDNHGHPTGDRVIKSLARLLQKRLRKTDSIGRYGGEEFAVIFWDADVAAASRILDEIREDFSKIEHRADSEAFSCTFSAGVAGFPEYPDGHSINSAADRALYVAKRQGRNRVMDAGDKEGE